MKLHKPGEHDAHDLTLLTMKSIKVKFVDLEDGWGDLGRKSIERCIQLFIAYNKRTFDFLNIEVYVSNEESETLIIKAHEFVGCAPLLSPLNGKTYANIVVRGKMNEDVSEIIPLLKAELFVEFDDKLKLPFSSSVRPPLYFECGKFIDKYLEVRKTNWRKFTNAVRVQNAPASSTLWGKYAETSYDPQKALRYPNKVNFLTKEHNEWHQLNYVLQLCLNEYDSSNTPLKSKASYRSKTSFLKPMLSFRNVVKTAYLQQHAADPLVVKELKVIGNRILNSITSEYRAWKLDFSKLYEGYVQYIWYEVAKVLGSHSHNNLKYSISGPHPSWDLSYLEPDLLFQNGEEQIVVDAKYKMHMFNESSETTEKLKESFRHDLHQVLAYSSFGISANKRVFLVYPCNRFRYIRQNIRSTFGGFTSDVFLLGIPWGDCKRDLSDTSTTQLKTIEEKIKETVEGVVGLIRDSSI